MKKFIFISTLYSLLFTICCGYAAAADMTGTAFVEKSGETAAAAKVAAINDARRQLFADVASRYANRGAIEAVSAGLSDAELNNMTSRVSIADERVSPTSYAANVTIAFAEKPVAQFLSGKGISNTIGVSNEVSALGTVKIYVSGGLKDYVELARTLRENTVWFSVQSMTGREITANVRNSQFNLMHSAMRGIGYRLSDNNGIPLFMK